MTFFGKLALSGGAAALVGAVLAGSDDPGSGAWAALGEAHGAAGQLLIVWFASFVFICFLDFVNEHLE